MHISQQFGNAIVHLSVLNQLATLEVIGQFTQAACQDMLAHLVPSVALAYPLACVVMYDRAVLENTVAELHEVTDDFKAAGLIVKTPVAVVVRAHDLKATVAHCNAMNALGIHRAAFTEREPAIDWAASRVAVIQEYLMERRATQFVA